MKYISIIIIPLLFVLSCQHIADKKESGKQNQKKTKTVQVPEFNGDSAYYFVDKQVSFGPRVAGMASHEQCADWLVHELKTFSDTVIVQPFKARTYDNITRQGKNIIASFNLDKKKRVLLMAHWVGCSAAAGEIGV